jgi:hypothetical protein
MDNPGCFYAREMKANGGASQHSRPAPSRTVNRLKDAVYREMYRLEAQQPGSEMGLALALLRVIVASQQSVDREEDFKDWIKEISPIALKMIEKGLDQYIGCSPAPR